MAMQSKTIDFQPTEWIKCSPGWLFTGVRAQTGLELDYTVMRGSMSTQSVLVGARPSSTSAQRVYLLGYDSSMAIGYDDGWIHSGTSFPSNKIIRFRSGILQSRQYLMMNETVIIDQQAQSNLTFDHDIAFGGTNDFSSIDAPTYTRPNFTVANLTYYSGIVLLLNGVITRNYLTGYLKNSNTAGLLDITGSKCRETGTPFYPFHTAENGTIEIGPDA